MLSTDPCAETECAEGEQCDLDDVRQPVCRCSDDVNRCADVPYAPVCASDWTTYANDCVMNAEACRRQSAVEVMWPGSCNPGQFHYYLLTYLLSLCFIIGLPDIGAYFLADLAFTAILLSIYLFSSAIPSELAIRLSRTLRRCLTGHRTQAVTTFYFPTI